MRLRVTIVLLALFTAGPALRLECLFTCGTTVTRTDGASCHARPPAAMTVAGVDHCVERDALPTLVVPRSLKLHALVETPAESTITSTRLASEHPLGSASPSPPPATYLTPLRI